MEQAAARRDDPVTATDTHTVLSPRREVKLPFAGELRYKLSPDVLIDDRPAATVDSVAQNIHPHAPPPGTSFLRPPTNLGRVVTGSSTVLVNGRPLARVGDRVETCNDPVDLPVGTITAGSPHVVAG